MPSYSGGSSGIQRRPASGRLMLAGGSMSGNASVREHQIARDEPHHVVSADRLLRLAAFVETMRGQQTLVQMADRHLRDVFFDDLLQIRELDVGDRAAAPLDLAGGGEAVPERLRQTVANQQALLLDVRHARAGQQRCIGAEQIAAALTQCRGPRIERFVAQPRARRNVCAVRIEAAVHAAPVDHVRLREVVIAHQFGFGVDEFHWTHLDLNCDGFLERHPGSSQCGFKSIAGEPVDARSGHRDSARWCCADSRRRRPAPFLSAHFVSASRSATKSIRGTA